MVDIYDNSSQTWTVKEINFFLNHSTPILKGNFAYFFPGGEDVRVYNVAADLWSVAKLDQDIGYSSILGYGRYIYFAGGGYPGKQHYNVRRLKF